MEKTRNNFRLNSKISILIAAMAFTLAYGEFLWRATAPGVDFYHYWALIKVKSVLDKDIGSPYLEQDQYARCLKAHTAKSSSPLLKKVNKIRSKLDVTGTPLQYSVFVILPLDYNLAIFLFRITQALVFIGTIVLLGTHFKTNVLSSFSFAFLLFVVYEPISQDLWVGNLNAIQLAFLTTIVLFAEKIQSISTSRNKILPSILFTGGLLFFALLKPNYVLIPLIMLAFLWRNIGTRLFISTSIAGGTLGLVTAIIPCFLFNTPWIWLDWWTQLQKLKNINTIFLYPISSGNFSTPLMLSKQFNLGSGYCLAIMCAFIILSLILALTIPFNNNTKEMIERFRKKVSCILQSPFLCLSIALTITLAISPLVWIHYLVVLLLPALWMILDKKFGETVGILASISVVMASGILLRILTLHSNIWLSKAPYMFGLAWIPLWIGILIIITKFSRDISTQNITKDESG